MGMFDYLYCEIPLPGNSPFGKETEFQTKDTTDQYLVTHKITKDGDLVVLGSNRVGFQTKDKTVLQNDDIFFYDIDEKTKKWWEFVAKFKGGKCHDIQLVENA